MQFRELGEKETALFIQWAKDNYTPGMQVNPLWHPVVRETIASLEKAFNAANSETPLGEAIDQGYEEYEPSPYDGTYSED
jgi:hypothetical protein